MTTENVKSQPQIQDDEIDLLALIKTVWINRIVLLKVSTNIWLVGIADSDLLTKRVYGQNYHCSSDWGRTIQTWWFKQSGGDGRI